MLIFMDTATSKDFLLETIAQRAIPVATDLRTTQKLFDTSSGVVYEFNYTRRVFNENKQALDDVQQDAFKQDDATTVHVWLRNELIAQFHKKEAVQMWRQFHIAIHNKEFFVCHDQSVAGKMMNVIVEFESRNPQ